MKLYLNTTREGYSPEQCRNTMTVSELMCFLEQYNDDTEVFFRNDNGYTYGSITEDLFSEPEDESEE